MISFGVMGAGKIARAFCSALNGIGGHLYAVGSRDIKKAQDYQKEFHIEKAFGSYEAMLSDASLDCVYIATPHGLHYEHMLMCLAYNKHILCEKAFTLNEAQAKHIFTLAKEKNLFVMEAMWTRFLPAVIAIENYVKDKKIGEIKSLTASFCFNANASKESRLVKPELGGGALLDLGVYVITYAHLFLGIPKHMTSSAHMVDGVDSSHQITFDYDHAQATLESAIDQDKPRDAYIYGEKGYIHIPNFWMAQEAFVYDLNHQLIEKIEHPHKVNGYEYEIFEVISCLERGAIESQIMTHQLTLDIMHIMDALRKQWDFKYPIEQ